MKHINIAVKYVTQFNGRQVISWTCISFRWQYFYISQTDFKIIPKFFSRFFFEWYVCFYSKIQHKTYNRIEEVEWWHSLLIDGYYDNCLELIRLKICAGNVLLIFFRNLFNLGTYSQTPRCTREKWSHKNIYFICTILCLFGK